MEEKVVGKSRIEVVDSLRGFAIMGIMLLHSIEHFNFFNYPELADQPAWLSSLDSFVWDALFFLFGGKGYAIFALLFGYTFGLMMNKQKKLGKDFGPRFLWRMLLLAGFAVINGLFFPGEVLMMYALLGVVLFFVRNLSTKYLLLVAVFFLLQPIEWFRYVYYVFNNEYVPAFFNDGALWRQVTQGQQSSSFFELITSNTLYGHKASLMWAYNVGRLLQTAGLFVLGYWIHQKQLFSDSKENTRIWSRTLIIAALVFIPLYLLKLSFDKLFDAEILKASVYHAVHMYGNFAFTLVLLASFVLLYQWGFFRKMAGGLRYCGRMSMTAYITQSIVGGFIFYQYGLGLGLKLGSSLSLLVGVLLFWLQFQFCKFWIKKYGRGPFEKLWHKLTWIKQTR